MSVKFSVMGEAVNIRQIDASKNCHKLLLLAVAVGIAACFYYIFHYDGIHKFYALLCASGLVLIGMVAVHLYEQLCFISEEQKEKLIDIFAYDNRPIQEYRKEITRQHREYTVAEFEMLEKHWQKVRARADRKAREDALRAPVDLDDED